MTGLEATALLLSAFFAVCAWPRRSEGAATYGDAWSHRRHIRNMQRAVRGNHRRMG